MGDDIRLEIIAVDKTRAAVDSAKRNMQGLEKAAQSANSTFAQIGKTAAGVFGGMAAFAAVNSIASGIMGIGAAAVDSYAKYERLTASLTALSAKEALLSGQAQNMQQALGMSAAKSKELVAWVERLAIQSPFGETDVASAFRMSMALGFTSKEAQRLTENMLDFTAATGADGQTLERIARAMGQIRTAGRLTAEDLNQLTEAGVDVARILEDGFGKPWATLRKEMEQGRLDSEKTIEFILADFERLYAGAGAAQATSFSGILSTLDELKGKIPRNLLSGIFTEAQPYMAAFVDVLSAPQFTAGVTALGDKLGALAGEQLAGAAATLQATADAFDQISTAAAPPWLAILGGVLAAGGGELNITPQLDPNAQPLDVPTNAPTTPTLASGFLSLFVPTIAPTTPSLDPNAPPVEVPAMGRIIGAFADPQHDIGAWVELDSTGRITKTVIDLQDEAGDGTLVTLDAKARVLSVDLPKGAPTINLVADWQTGTLGSLINAAMNPAEGKKILLEAGWESGTLGAMWGAAWSFFGGQSVLLNALWSANVIGDLWSNVQTFFSSNPISVMLNADAPARTAGEQYSGHANFPRRPSPVGGQLGESWPVDITPANRASGGPAQGFAMVGERGPELAYFGANGGYVWSNPDTRKMLGRIPGYADGNAPGGADIFKNLMIQGVKALGAWVETPAGPGAHFSWKTFQKDGEQAFVKAAQNTESAFVDAANASTEATSRALESMLQGTPGLFGTSAVTADQMRQAEAGVPQNFADNYLRRLTDEVLNGVDWQGVDIKDAAGRAGIDPNLPANMVLEMFRAAWEDSSLFANPENLDLIDTSAVETFVQRQQAAALGKANVLAFFGDPDVANNALGAMAGAIGSAAGSEDNAAALRDAGMAGAAVYYSGWQSFMSGAAIVPPGAAPGTATGVPVPPGKAIGVSNWPGGAMRVHRDETIFLPHGAGVATATESQRGRMGGGQPQIVNHVTVTTPVDEEAFTNRIARRLRARMQ